MMEGSPRSLPLNDWPDADRLAWRHECRDGARLRRGGRASHLSPVTGEDLAKRYGLFLDFLDRSHSLNRSAAAGSHVTPKNVDAFVAELRQRVRSVTLYGSVYKLRRATEIIAPEQELSWLRDLERDLDLLKQPRSKVHRLILAEVLVKAGLTLMIEADAAEPRTPLQRATQYRNGLMIALLACCPVRLKNFAALAIRSSIVQVKDCWWIVLTAQDTKEKRPDERCVPTFLSTYVDRYVSVYRAALARPARSGSALWLSKNGEPMSYLGVEGTITRTTMATTGISVSPHLFRVSAASTAAIHAASTPRLASGILDHRDERTTQQHYNRATSLTAATTYQEIVSDYLK